MGICLGLLLTVSAHRPATAQQPPPDSACRLCHTDTDETLALPDGEELSLGIDPTIIDASVHGGHSPEIGCTDCHRPHEEYLYPHTAAQPESRTAFLAKVAESCSSCHLPADQHNPGHLGVLDNSNIPNCVDCHGGHDATSAASMAADPVGTCLNCHQEFGDPQSVQVHEEFAHTLDKDKNCTTCHNDQAISPNQKCESCHTLLQSEKTLASGETLSLHLDLAELAESVHGLHLINTDGGAPLKCADCHVDMERYGFPHPESNVMDLRELQLGMQNICGDCHEDIYRQQLTSVHGKAQAYGTMVAASCVDCHGSHDVENPSVPREKISQTCGNCHSTINDQYEHSVHGAALLGEQNPDVPVCTDCHGVHDIGDPRTAEFRLSSPEMCGKCHADKELMEKYDISTNVFDSYVSDFHGTTVALFEEQSPHEETNKAVCYDCHGVHDILPATDENSHIIRANLLVTCRQCHPDAGDNFPDAWMSHFEPSLEHNTLVFFVDWFYRLLIPGVMAGFSLFIGADIYRTVRNRYSRKKGEKTDDIE